MAKDSKIYVLMVIAAFFWAAAFIAGKYTGPYIPSASVTCMRFAIAAVMLYFIMRDTESKKGEDAYRFRKRDIPRFLFTGIVGMAGYHVFFFEAMHYTSVANASVIRAADPVVTVLIAFAFLHQRVPLKQLFGILLSLAGVVLTITEGHPLQLLSEAFNRGDLYMIFAVLGWSAYGVYSKSRCSHIPPVVLTFYSFLVCAAVLLPFSLMEKPWVFIPEIPAAAWAALIFMGVFSSGVAYYIQQAALRRIGPARCSVFVNLVPIFSFILAAVLLGEQIAPVKIFTTAVIITGVCICQLAGSIKEEK